MALQNPYVSALNVDPNREASELAKLKTDPAKLASLGLQPNEDFSKLKNDPVKYNKVLAYVKGQVYQNPATLALSQGQTKPEFATAQVGTEYAKTASEFKNSRAPVLQTQYNIPQLQDRATAYENAAPAAPMLIADKVKKEGGYDIEGLKDTFTKLRDDYTSAYQQFVSGAMSADRYAGIVSQLNTAKRNLEKAQTGYDTEVSRATGNYQSMQTSAKTSYENAYKKYQDALDAEASGYKDSREEKLTAAKEMFDASKALVDEAKKQQDTYQEARGKIYNPNTGKYESKPVSGTAIEKSFYDEAAKQQELLANGTLQWDQAWQYMAQRFPAQRAKIDGALGGSAGYDPKTNTFNAQNATGFGRAGAYQELEAKKKKPDEKNNLRTAAYSDLDVTIKNYQKANPSETGKKLFGLIVQKFPELTDGEIKSYMISLGIDPSY